MKRKDFHLLLGSSYSNLYTAKEEDIVVGINSKVEDGHIVLMEFDNTNLQEVTRKVEGVLSDFDLSDFYIMNSSKGCYHCISFTVVDFDTYIGILESARVNEEYIHFTKRHDMSTLRVSKKWYKKTSNVELKEVVEGMGEERKDLKEQYFDIVNIENTKP